MRYILGVVMAVCLSVNSYAETSTSQLEQAMETNNLLKKVLQTLSQEKPVVALTYDRQSHCVYNNRLYSAGSRMVIEGEMVVCESGDSFRDAKWYARKKQSESVINY